LRCSCLVTCHTLGEFLKKKTVRALKQPIQYKRVTIKSIAQHMGVTPATISKALRDSSDISEKTRKRVKQIAAEMGYKPNLMAQSLVRQRSDILGVIVPNLRISFFSEVTRGIYECARAIGYETIIMVNDENMDTERKNLEFLLAMNVDGLLVNAVPGTDNNDLFTVIRERGIPIVVYDRRINEMDFPSVTIDDEAAAFEVMTHFIQHGRKDILFLGPTKTLTVAQGRYNGYRKALTQNRIPYCEERIVPCEIEQEAAKSSMTEILNSGKVPDAVMCIGGLVAYGAGQAIRQAQLRVPEDIMLSEFGDNDVVYRLGVPFITVDQHPYQMGKEAVDLLSQYIKNKNLPYEHKIVDTKMILHEVG